MQARSPFGESLALQRQTRFVHYAGYAAYKMMSLALLEVVIACIGSTHRRSIPRMMANLDALKIVDTSNSNCQI